MPWLTDNELTRALNSAGVPKNRKTVRHWPQKAPGISRLIAGRRMFHPRLAELLLAGHALRDIGTALAAEENGAPPNQLDLLPSATSRRGNPRGNPRKHRPERPADIEAAR